MPSASLRIVTYHYVRDTAHSAYPAIKGIGLVAFRKQLDDLADACEMATLESSMAFLRGEFTPPRDLCLLTFDDGLRDHYANVAPVLADRGVQGVFFIITSCPEERRVAPVHMNHFLTAALGFEKYRKLFLDALLEQAPASVEAAAIDPEIAQSTYRWDDARTAQFKYLFNFALGPEARDSVVAGLFERYVGAESDFSRDLYFSWDEARRMQAAGMAMGGHTHRHRPLSAMPDTELARDLSQCKALLESRLSPAPAWPFSYPYGKSSSYTSASVGILRELGFACSFTTEEGDNQPGTEMFSIRRVDTNKATVGLRPAAEGVAHAG